MNAADPTFHETCGEAASWLMREFLAWNDIQESLREKGYESNCHDAGELEGMRRAFAAIGERFVLEGVDYKAWEWFETPWAGTDGNTGREAYIVDFVLSGVEEPELGILGFYVTRNDRFWFAIPLAEVMDGGVTVCEVNSIQAAIDMLKGDEGV